MLDRLLHGKGTPPEPFLVAPRSIVERQSTDVVAIDDPDVAAAVRYIRTRAHEQINVKNVLGAVAVCRKTIDVRFMKFLGRTPAEEIRRVRVEQAKRLLADTDLPISAVAKTAGFTGQEAFSVFFRREAGLTPTEYRRQWLPGRT